MTHGEALLNEFTNEAASTRKTLERVPEAQFGWQPHAKSFPLGALASHLARIPGWGAATLTTESMDLKPEDMAQDKPVTSTAELLALFDQSVAGFTAALQAATDEQLRQPWTLSMNGHVIFTQPRIGVLRGMIFNHTVHHRAQLGVYLRLLDIPVPSIYGPSADEKAG